MGTNTHCIPAPKELTGEHDISSCTALKLMTVVVHHVFDLPWGQLYCVWQCHLLCASVLTHYLQYISSGPTLIRPLTEESE